MSSGSEYMDLVTLKNDLPANEVDLVPMKYEKDIKKETVTSYDAEMEVETEINEEIDIDKHQLSYEQQHSIETIEAVCKSDCSTKCYVLLQRLHPDYGQHTNDMVTIKLETNEKKEDISDSMEIDIEQQNTVIDDINHEDEITENDLSYEQLEPVKSEDYKIEDDNEHIERTASKCYVSLDKLDYDHGQKDNDNETIKDEQNVEKAYTSESADLFQCSMWRDKTQIRKTIIEHCRMQFNRKTEWHQCHLCNFKTQYEGYLRQHHSSKHKIFYCNLCDYKTKNKYNLWNHHRSKHDHSAKIFHCNLCDYKTKRKSHLVEHHTLKHDDLAEIFSCDLCDYKTKRKYNLSQHYKLKHDDTAEIFHCELCNFQTKYKGSLKHHRIKHDEAATKHKNNLMQHHTEKHEDSAKIFHCKLCNYKTKYKHHLLQHKLKHDDAAEIFHCGLCDYKTKRKDTLLQHHRSRHDDEAEIYRCKLCNFKTKYKGSLKHHRSKHNEKRRKTSYEPL